MSERDDFIDAPRKPGERPTSSKRPRRPSRTNFPWGPLFVVIGVQVAAQFLFGIFSGGWSLLFPGVTQLVYLLPWWIWALVKKRPAYAYTIAGVAGLTAMLNATCFAMFKYG